MDTKEIYSILDANINRALEGLRVCEDACRFGLKNGAAALRIKEIRHRIAGEAKTYPSRLLLGGRDVERDAAKFVDTEGEMERGSLEEIVRANLHRAMEAARSLEEFSKLLGERKGNPFQEARFALYELEKEVVSLLGRGERMALFPGALCAVLDPDAVPGGDCALAAKRLIDGGASIISLRMRGAQPRRRAEAAREVAAECREKGALFLVSGDPAAAILSGADGVHLGREDVAPADARRILGPAAIIGVSARSEEEAREAAADRPDYISLGPVFDTADASGRAVKGMGADAAGAVMKRLEIPLVCAGGITPEGVSALRKHGNPCFAAMSFLYRGGAIEENCRAMMRAIERGHGSGT